MTPEELQELAQAVRGGNAGEEEKLQLLQALNDNFDKIKNLLDAMPKMAK